MSGVEAAGLTLAVLPLVRSAAKSYNDVLSPFLRFKRFTKEAKRYSKELEVQRTIFREECRSLLESVIDHDAASGMLELLAKELWSDYQLEEKIAQQLGESKQACVTLVELIEEQLRDIGDENDEFCTIADQERQATSKLLGPKGSRHDLGKKLRFSFSESRLDGNIAGLRTHNKDLRTLFNQLRRPRVRATIPRSRGGRECRNNIRRYKTIGEASRQVYEALGKACNKHTEHVAHFRVEVEHVIFDEERTPQVKFSVAFTHLTLTGSTNSSDPIWFLVNSTIDDEATSSSRHVADLGELGKTLKRQIEAVTSQPPKKNRNCVRFQSSAPVPSSTFPPLIAPDAFSSETCIRRDLCDDLRRCFRQPREADVCVGILKSTDKCKHYVYPSPHTHCSQPRTAISLGQLIRTSSNFGTMGGIPIHERLSLAKTLAIAVLQYHSTPWMRLSWRDEDILFFSADNPRKAQGIPDLSAPHLNAKVKGPDGQLSRALTFPVQRLARNPILFSLGVVLLEIAHATSLENMKQDGDLTNGQEDPYTEFFTARRLAKLKSTTMGLRYDSIVEKLVECIFPNADDLNNDELQAAFYGDIICPLADLEERLRRFHMDD